MSVRQSAFLRCACIPIQLQHGNSSIKKIQESIWDYFDQYSSIFPPTVLLGFCTNCADLNRNILLKVVGQMGVHLCLLLVHRCHWRAKRRWSTCSPRRRLSQKAIGPNAVRRRSYRHSRAAPSLKCFGRGGGYDPPPFCHAFYQVGPTFPLYSSDQLSSPPAIINIHNQQFECNHGRR